MEEDLSYFDVYNLVCSYKQWFRKWKKHHFAEKFTFQTTKLHEIKLFFISTKDSTISAELFVYFAVTGALRPKYSQRCPKMGTKDSNDYLTSKYSFPAA